MDSTKAWEIMNKIKEAINQDIKTNEMQNLLGHFDKMIGFEFTDIGLTIYFKLTGRGIDTIFTGTRTHYDIYAKGKFQTIIDVLTGKMPPMVAMACGMKINGNPKDLITLSKAMKKNTRKILKILEE